MPLTPSRYTTNSFERFAAIGNTSFDEGIVAYVAPNGGCGSVPLFRLRRPGGIGPNGPDPRRVDSEDDFYTIDAAEMERAIATEKYKFIEIVGYVWPA